MQTLLPILVFARWVLMGCFIVAGRTVNGQQITLESGVQFGWPTMINNSYRPQWSPNLSGAWTDFDGRARTLEEAILWHGGEAEASKEVFRAMPATDRDALIKFLKSL